MADIFLSYKSERRAATEHFARTLELNGYSVWFDYGLLSGKNFARQIERELRAAKAVVVLWCSRSTESEWVNNEARLASRIGSFLPVWIEEADLPLEFNGTETVDLKSWDGAPRSHALDKLFIELAKKIGKEQQPDVKRLREFESQWRRYGAPRLTAFPLSKAVPELEGSITDLPEAQLPTPTFDSATKRRSWLPVAGAATLAVGLGVSALIYTRSSNPLQKTSSSTPPAVTSEATPPGVVQPQAIQPQAAGPALSPDPKPDEDTARRLAEIEQQSRLNEDRAKLTRGRLLISQAEQALKSKNAVVAAALARAALDIPQVNAAQKVEEQASALLFRGLSQIEPAQPAVPIPGLPPGTGPLIADATFSPNGKYYAIRAGSAEFRVMETETGKVVNTVHYVGRSRNIAFSENSRKLLIEDEEQVFFVGIGEGETVRWRLERAAERETGFVELSSDGRWFADIRNPRAIVIRDAATGKPLFTPIALRGSAVRVFFSPDGSLFTASVAGHFVGVWRTLNGQPVMSVPLSHNQIASGTISDDNSLLLVAIDEDPAPRLFDLARRQPITVRSRAQHAKLGGSSFFLRGGNGIATIGENGLVVISEARTGQELSRFTAGKAPLGSWEQSGDGEILFFTTGDKQHVGWRWRQRERISQNPITWQEALGSVVLPDGSSMVVVQNGAIQRVQLAKPEERRSFGPLPDPNSNTLVLDASVDGQYAAVTSASAGVTVWNVESGRRTLDLRNDSAKKEDSVRSIAISPHLPMIAVGAAKEEGEPPRVFNLQHGGILLTFQKSGRVPLLYSGKLQFSRLVPQFLYEITATDFRSWNLEKRELQFTIGTAVKNWQSVFEGVDKNKEYLLRVIAHNSMHHLSVLDVTGGMRPEDRKWLVGHAESIQDTRFDNSGKYVFSASSDKTVRVWDWRAGTELQMVRIPEGIKTLRISKDGKTVWIVTEDSSVHMWEWESNRLVRGEPFSDCKQSEVAGDVVLCATGTSARGEVSRVRNLQTGRVTAEVDGMAQLLEDGTHLIKWTGDRATLVKIPASLDELKLTADKAMTGYQDQARSALAAVP